MKLIIFLTDGQGAYDEKYEQMATERGVKIYTVGLGKIYDADLLRKISWNTGGKHYHANHADDLIEEFRQFTRDTIDIVTDSDSDGLSDYHEERIRLFNGVYINSGGEYQGKACTDETDPINMGSYNYEGRYKSDSSKVIGHAQLDVLPYGDIIYGKVRKKGKRWGNVSPEDYMDPIGEDEYKKDSDADAARQSFIADWGGQ